MKLVGTLKNELILNKFFFEIGFCWFSSDKIISLMKMNIIENKMVFNQIN